MKPFTPMDREALRSKIASDPDPDAEIGAGSGDGLCPHGMPLAENVCGPCSQGRPNRFECHTPYECIATLCAKQKTLPYYDGERRYREGERQQFCERCRHWRFADEQCNLFAHGAHQSSR